MREIDRNAKRYILLTLTHEWDESKNVRLLLYVTVLSETAGSFIENRTHLYIQNSIDSKFICRVNQIRIKCVRKCFFLTINCFSFQPKIKISF